MSIRIDGIDNVSPYKNLNLYKVHEVMTSNKITTSEKIEFMKKNRVEITRLADEKVSSDDFKAIMNHRPLEILRPLKNSYTKAGDKKLLAISLGITPGEVNDYIKDMTLQISSLKSLDELGLSKDTYDKVKLYVFRHGTKEQVVKYLDYELKHAKDILITLYHILDYNSGGVADYFLRPIHRLDNNTILDIYSVIDKNLKLNQSLGNISDVEERKIAECALARIYTIQNNQKLKNALRLKRELS